MSSSIVVDKISAVAQSSGTTSSGESRGSVAAAQSSTGKVESSNMDVSAM